MDDTLDQRADKALVAAVQAGDRDAFGPLLQRHYPSLLRLCRRLLGPTLEAQDVAQEAALQAFLGLDGLTNPDRFGPWLHAIGANLARTALRRRRALSLELLDEAALAPSARQRPGPEQISAMREVHDTIVAALSELSAVNREAVIGFYLEGYSYEELAALLGVPVSTVKGRLFKGRSRLRERLAPLAAELLQPDRRTRKGAPMPEGMIALQVHSLYVESWGHRVALLRAAGDERVLPIWVDPLGADAIALALNNDQLPRPATHDLMLRLIGQLDAPLEHVTIKRVADEVYFGELALRREGGLMRVDVRCSDALALALRSGAPIFIDREVYTSGCLPFDEFAGLGGASDAQVDQVLRYTITNVGSLSLVDVAARGPEQRPAEWAGQAMVAVRLPHLRSAIGLWCQLPGEGEPMWLLLSPERWGRVARQAEQRTQMLGERPDEEGR